LKRDKNETKEEKQKRKELAKQLRKEMKDKKKDAKDKLRTYKKQNKAAVNTNNALKGVSVHKII